MTITSVYTCSGTSFASQVGCCSASFRGFTLFRVTFGYTPVLLVILLGRFVPRWWTFHLTRVSKALRTNPMVNLATHAHSRWRFLMSIPLIPCWWQSEMIGELTETIGFLPPGDQHNGFGHGSVVVREYTDGSSDVVPPPDVSDESLSDGTHWLTWARVGSSGLEFDKRAWLGSLWDHVDVPRCMEAGPGWTTAEMRQCLQQSDNSVAFATGGGSQPGQQSLGFKGSKLLEGEEVYFRAMTFGMMMILLTQRRSQMFLLSRREETRC